MFTMAKDKAEMAKDEMINEGGQTGNAQRDPTRRFKDEARETASDLKDGMHDVRDSVESVVRRMGRHTRGLADSASEGAEGLLEQASKTVRKNPVGSVAAVFAIGLFAGLLYGRR